MLSQTTEKQLNIIAAKHKIKIRTYTKKDKVTGEQRRENKEESFTEYQSNAHVQGQVLVEGEVGQQLPAQASLFRPVAVPFCGWPILQAYWMVHHSQVIGSTSLRGDSLSLRTNPIIPLLSLCGNIRRSPQVASSSWRSFLPQTAVCSQGHSSKCPRAARASTLSLLCT